MPAVPSWLAVKFDRLRLPEGGLVGAFGPYGDWADSLRHSVAAVANSGFPMFLLWGPK